MHPAPSVILFTVASGLGFGLLAFLGLGWPQPQGWLAFFHWGLGYGLAVGGLLASTFHLGHPERAMKAFSQWQSSWLSREAWGAVAALLVLAPMALSDWLGLGWSRGFGGLGAVLALATVFVTSMIYAQLKTIPRWHHWTTPALFLGFALTGGAILSGHIWPALAGLVGLGGLMAFNFANGAGRFVRAGQTTGTATGLGQIGQVSVFEQPHTSPNYLMQEMIYRVARKHVVKLQWIALTLAAGLPAVILLLAGLHLVPALPALGVAALLHVCGAATQRWLFFAQAEHVVGLFYGAR